MSLACNSQLYLYMGKYKALERCMANNIFLIIFILLVNLELGFPVCFYNGMDIEKLVCSLPFRSISGAL